MTNEVKKKGDDGELASILIVLGLIFTGTLTAVDIFYGNMSGLMDSWFKWPFIVLHVLALIQWFVVLKTRNEPNLEWVRWTLTITVFLALILVLAHRGAWLGDKAFQQEVDKNKQQQKQDTVIREGVLRLDTAIKK